MAVPNRLKMPVDMAVNNKIIHELESEPFKIHRLKHFLESSTHINVTLDIVTLSYLTDKKLNSLMRQLREDPENLELLTLINEFLQLIKESPLEPNEWEAQNLAFEVKDEQFEHFSNEEKAGNEQAGEWIKAFVELEKKLNLVP